MKTNKTKHKTCTQVKQKMKYSTCFYNIPFEYRVLPDDILHTIINFMSTKLLFENMIETMFQKWGTQYVFTSHSRISCVFFNIQVHRLKRLFVCYDVLMNQMIFRFVRYGYHDTPHGYVQAQARVIRCVIWKCDLLQNKFSVQVEKID